MTHKITIATGLLLLAFTGSLRADVDLPWRGDATDALRAALFEQYPDVLQWSIEPVDSARGHRTLPKTAPTSMKVTQLGSRSAVRIAWANQRVPYTHTQWFDVSGTSPVTVVVRDVAPNSALLSADAEVRIMDRLKISCALVGAPADLIGMRARRPMREGTAICRDAIEPRPAVVRGDPVVVQFVSRRVSIQGRGIAQADGKLGQQISVMNSESRQLFAAVVSSENEVTVSEQP